MISADSLAHPVRMRVVLALVGGRELTTRGLAEELPEIRLATLYRHVSALSEAGILSVVAERRVRGAVERTYALRPEFELSPELTLADRQRVATMSAADQRAAFRVFAATLIAAYDGYLGREDHDIVDDPVGYRIRAVYATEADVRSLTENFTGALAALSGDRPGARRILVSTVLIPT